MWHEARKQERKIRGMIVDYRKRAERRQDFYERIQADPTQFIQIHGRRCKIHLDPAVAAAGDGAAIIVPWHGQQDNLIDRFDVRAHLDIIPPVPKTSDLDSSELSFEERQCNYERYRILAQNDFLNLTEDKFLHQLFLEEQYGANAQLETERNLGKKKQPRGSGATIAYSYEDTDSIGGAQPFSHILNLPQVPGQSFSNDQRNEDDESDSDIDMDVSIDISKLDTSQAHELNACGRNYGMAGNDFYSYLTKDVDEADALRMAREEEQEKMLLSGRKSRRERRAQKERRVAGRPFSPPSYAAKEELTGGTVKQQDIEESDSRSPSPPDNSGKITYITSFGGEDELQPHSKISINLNSKSQNSVLGSGFNATSTETQPTYAQKVKENLDKLKIINERSRPRQFQNKHSSRWNRSRSRSRTRDRHHRSRSRSRGRYHRYERSHRSRSLSYRGRSKYREKSRSRSRRRYRRSTSSSSSSSSTRSSSSSSHSKNRHKHRTRYSKSRSKTRSPLKTSRLQTQKKCNEPEKKNSVQINPLTIPKAQDVVQYPPMISYPLRTGGTTSSQAEIEIAKPKAEPLPPAQEPPPPLKRYYGRKRADDDSSDSNSEVDHTADSTNEVKDVKIEQQNRAESQSQDDNEDAEATCSSYSNPAVLPKANSPSDKQLLNLMHQSGQAPCLSNSTETKNCGGGTAIVAVSGSNSRTNLRERLKRKMQNLLNKQYKADKRAEIEKSERERQLQQEREDEMRELALKLRRRQRELRHKYGKDTPNRSESKSSESETNQAAKVNIDKSPSKSRSKSHSSEKLLHRAPESEELNRNNRQTSNRLVNRSRSISRNRNRTRSRSRSNHQRSYHRRSRSRSRNRRSRSKRRNRSPSRSYRHHIESNTERSRYSRAKPDDRYRRSRSKISTQERYRTLDRDREERDRGEREREKDRERERERDRDRCRERNRMRHNSPSKDGANGARASTDSNSNRNNRNRVVISAPPKLKKLVDY